MHGRRNGSRTGRKAQGDLEGNGVHVCPHRPGRVTNRRVAFPMLAIATLKTRTRMSNRERPRRQVQEGRSDTPRPNVASFAKNILSSTTSPRRTTRAGFTCTLPWRRRRSSHTGGGHARLIHPQSVRTHPGGTNVECVSGESLPGDDTYAPQ
jgi:hypothetical protein